MKLSVLKRMMLTMLTLISLNVLADDLAALPKKNLFRSPDLITSLRSYDTAFDLKPVLKVCACQLLTVRSNNQQLENIAVFSEKVNNGDVIADFAVATEVLEKEKKHLKMFFYETVKVVGRQVVATDCKTFYRQLKVKYEDLKMFELLDADAISRFNNLNR